MIKDYSFLTRGKTNTKDYSFLLRDTPPVEIVQQNNLKKVRLPNHLGGGEYMLSGSGEVYLSPRSQDAIGPAKTGFERDHIVPVSLGGTSNLRNLQYLESKPSFWNRLFGKKTSVQQSPNRQEGKLKVEQEAINKFKQGNISADEARLMIAMENMRIQGLVPKASKETTWGNLGAGIKESLKQVFVNAPVELAEQIGVNILGSFDFLHRTGLHLTSGVGILADGYYTSVAKFLGDKSLKDINYDEIWADALKRGGDRLLDIGHPAETFISQVSKSEYRPVALYDDLFDKLAKNAISEAEKGNRMGTELNIAKMFGLKFAIDWANPFYIATISGIRYNPLKPRGEVLSRGRVLIPSKVLKSEGSVMDKTIVLKMNMEKQSILKYSEKGALKLAKEPDVRIWLTKDSKNHIYYDIRNLGGKIFNNKGFETIGNMPASQGSYSVIKHSSDILPAKIDSIAPFKGVAKSVKATTPSVINSVGKTSLLHQEALKYKTLDKFINSQIKQEQLNTIHKLNPIVEWNIEDIKTLPETIKDPESFVYPDFNKAMAKSAIKSGKITIYSFQSLNNANAQFVSPSKIMITNYADGRKVFSKVVKIEDVAWINGSEGQFTGNIKQQLTKVYNKAYKASSIKTLVETPKVAPKVETPKEPSLSKHYERVKEQYGFKDSVEFTPKTELKEKQKAFRYIQDKPDKALRIGYGYEEMPKGINPQVFRASLVSSLISQGKTSLAQEVARVQSLAMTEAAQTLAFGRLDIGSNARITQNITKARLEKLGKGLGERAPSKRVETAKKKVKAKAKKEVKKIKEKQIPKTKAEQVKEMDDLINSLIC